MFKSTLHPRDLLTSDPWSHLDHLNVIQELAPLTKSIETAKCTKLRQVLQMFHKVYNEHPYLEESHSFWSRQIQNKRVSYKEILHAVSELLESYFHFLHLEENEHKHHKSTRTKWLDHLYQKSSIGTVGEMIFLGPYQKYLEPSQLTRDTYGAWRDFLKKLLPDEPELAGSDMLLDNFRGWIEYVLTVMYLVEFLCIVKKGQTRFQYHCAPGKS